MKEWMDSRGQLYSSKETKIELYQKIRKHKEARIFKVDQVFAKHGYFSSEALTNSNASSCDPSADRRSARSCKEAWCSERRERAALTRCPASAKLVQRLAPSARPPNQRRAANKQGNGEVGNKRDTWLRTGRARAYFPEETKQRALCIQTYKQIETSLSITKWNGKLNKSGKWKKWNKTQTRIGLVKMRHDVQTHCMMKTDPSSKRDMFPDPEAPAPPKGTCPCAEAPEPVPPDEAPLDTAVPVPPDPPPPILPPL
ncbi:hypothetical protein J437_LFUL003612 [Ladona fulva]|uniref:Uncharacterized protein n=1 Tax=Ladona fulva TaxID=123851 RepID=A0A8K0KHI4_LADFU|nr:hypothetical protein J437_LFUL003612 [Ladona fulva]